MLLSALLKIDDATPWCLQKHFLLEVVDLHRKNEKTLWKLNSVSESQNFHDGIKLGT